MMSCNNPSVPRSHKALSVIVKFFMFMANVALKSITLLPAALLAFISVFILFSSNEDLLSMPSELAVYPSEIIIAMLKDSLLSIWKLAFLIAFLGGVLSEGYAARSSSETYHKAIIRVEHAESERLHNPEK